MKIEGLFMVHDINNLLNLRETTNHPLSLRYSEIYSAAILNGKLEHGRAQPGLNTKNSTPFVIAARKAVHYGINKSGAVNVIADCLGKYYEMVQPLNAAQWLGLNDTSHQKLLDSPPWAGVFPWRARSLESYQSAYENAALSENMAVGREMGISDGWLFCGPVSESKILIEAERILHVLKCIDKQGYIRSDESDGDVKATVLVNEKHEWRWLITAGNHRASAAAALGYESIPIRANLVISRSDSIYWKHVVEGLFTQDEALTVFDNFFNGEPIALLGSWFAQNGLN
jgi:hypothetical protein